MATSSSSARLEKWTTRLSRVVDIKQELRERKQRWADRIRATNGELAEPDPSRHKLLDPDSLFDTASELVKRAKTKEEIHEIDKDMRSMIDLKLKKMKLRAKLAKTASNHPDEVLV